MSLMVKGLTKAVEWFCTTILLAILVMVLLQIVFRDILKVSAPWTEEGARYLLVAMVFFGAAVVYQRNGHIRLAVLRNLGPKSSLVLDTIGDLAVLGCSVVLFFGSVKMVQMNWHIPSITITFAPLGLLYVFSGAGSALVAMLSMIRIGQRLVGGK